MNEEHALLVSFPDQSEQFVLGFEAGQIWEMLADERGMLRHGESVSRTIHASNQEVVRRMAQHYEFTVEFPPESIADGWCTASFVRGSKPRLRSVK